MSIYISCIRIILLNTDTYPCVPEISQYYKLYVEGNTYIVYIIEFLQI